MRVHTSNDPTVTRELPGSSFEARDNHTYDLFALSVLQLDSLWLTFPCHNLNNLEVALSSMLSALRLICSGSFLKQLRNGWALFPSWQAKKLAELFS